jgi:hypothetical protein
MEYYDDMLQGIAAEHQALAPIAPPPVHALPVRAYLDATVLPLLIHALESVANDRPKDPIEYLAAYLISNNPQRDDIAAALPTSDVLCGLAPPVETIPSEAQE